MHDYQSLIRHKLSVANHRLQKLISLGISTVGWILWIGGTSIVTLVGPVMFHYDRECQLLEMQQQIIQAQQAATTPILN
ncbi:mitochondrial import receptor subunit TOM22, putative (TOM22) [Babesia microti strain RI]|uniref:Mitochondrial import receptor subunit TOM22, putative (TOM22) n=1 Tax=Babesia microti (strain RI) TaxID=1133968 RepID=I7J5J3_BABMR|nr:mitochondrial import receptor subunit TOM22, putative (TOM22) [Babesia microti strain RI]CCF72932.1 mitochondrial import receptor subunit TOM22, putative (TOM22) [Babesia microti strain RI]|eukprot:XP_012647541.1 mitochondrial import receptor subunit TOM22, putative (TOM22) [Babesia microti strain RI]